jgi:RHS repeat-associated protein
VDYYVADVASASDYYPFGMQMPSLILTASNTNYRYGFNGKELDPNMDGNNYDYGFRIYNPQIGKFLSTDPLAKKYPWYTPYQFAGNKPIWQLI